MMLFWFKKKTVVLDCFTHLNFAYNIIPIERATKYIPDWYKKLKHTNVSNPYEPPFVSMKSCPGFRNYFSHSFALPMWDHIHVRVSKNDISVLCDSLTYNRHDNEQYGELLDTSYIHFKMSTPWFINSKSDTKFIQTFPMWCYQAKHKPEKILHCPGVVDFKTQSSTNVNIFIKRAGEKEEDYIVTFEPGVPLVFYTPLDKVEIKIKNHLLTKEEYNQKSAAIGSTISANRYYTYKKLIEKRDEGKKCPLGFK